MSAKLKERQSVPAPGLATDYLLTFTGSDHGKRTLKDIVAKFPPDCLRFYNPNIGFDSDPVRAAYREGQASVTREFLKTIEAGKRVK